MQNSFPAYTEAVARSAGERQKLARTLFRLAGFVGGLSLAGLGLSAIPDGALLNLAGKGVDLTYAFLVFYGQYGKLVVALALCSASIWLMRTALIADALHTAHAADPVLDHGPSNIWLRRMARRVHIFKHLLGAAFILDVASLWPQARDLAVSWTVLVSLGLLLISGICSDRRRFKLLAPHPEYNEHTYAMPKFGRFWADWRPVKPITRDNAYEQGYLYGRYNVRDYPAALGNKLADDTVRELKLGYTAGRMARDLLERKGLLADSQ